MNVLLDTHVWVWAAEDPDRLGRRARRLLLHERNEVCVSPVSSLELTRLYSTGKISLKTGLLDWIRESCAALHASTLPLTHEVAVEAYSLPNFVHEDPADRILIATARINAAVLLSADRAILEYRDVRSLDARK